MSIKRRTFLIALALLVLFLALFLIARLNKDTPVILGDWPYYPDVENITKAADVIIIGDVISAKSVEQIKISEKRPEDLKTNLPYTISTVKVSRVLKGDVNVGDEISIRQLGDHKRRPESTLQRINGYLSKNQECLMFLAEFDDLPYAPLNPGQGIIWIKEGTKLYSPCEYALFGYKDSENTELISIETAIDEISKFTNK